jgi:hypothetical protein
LGGGGCGVVFFETLKFNIRVIVSHLKGGDQLESPLYQDK